MKQYYPDTKIDLSTSFMEKSLNLCKTLGFVSMINIPVWMTLSGCYNFRTQLINNNTLINMLHFGRGVFGSDFGSTAFVFLKQRIQKFRGTYRRLFTKQGAVDSLDQKEKWFFEKFGEYTSNQDNYVRIPGHIFSYQISEHIYLHFTEDKKIGDFATAKQGLITGNNDRFLRLWFEISFANMQTGCQSREETIDSNVKWYPYNKGGEYRKWYGNCWYVVDWFNDGEEIQHYYDSTGKLRSRPQNMSYYFKEGLTWTALTAGIFSMRYSPTGFIFDAMGPTCFSNSKNDSKYILGLLNSKVGAKFLRILCPNLKFDQKPIERVPYIYEKSETDRLDLLVEDCINIAKNDWDTDEISWNYKRHPLLNYGVSIYSGLGDGSNPPAAQFGIEKKRILI